jgi:hypothetical protein
MPMLIVEVMVKKAFVTVNVPNKFTSKVFRILCNDNSVGRASFKWKLLRLMRISRGPLQL